MAIVVLVALLEHPSPGPSDRCHRSVCSRSKAAEAVQLAVETEPKAEIAARLFVSAPTVKTHINSLFAKLQVRDRSQAIALALGR